MARKKSNSGKENRPRITPGKAKNAVGVAKVLGPAVLPVLAPYAMRALAGVRSGYDRLRARRLGVDVGQLDKFSGHGGALHARIAGDLDAVRELADNRTNESDVRFAGQAQSTLDKLTAAVRAAERMPTARRKAAHRAVSAELDTLERELLDRLGVR